MIPVSTFNIMLVFDMALIFYAFIDDKNPLFTDIAAAFAAGFLSTYLGVAVRTDIIHEGTGTATALVNSSSLGLVFIFAGVCMFLLCLYKILKYLNSIFEARAEREEQELKGEGWQ